jgi:RNA polymerase sigma factor (sigma-70 family)
MINYNNDDQLADAVQRGDIAAQEAFFNRFQLPLIKFAMKKYFSYEDAEDLAQETLATGFRTIASFRRGEFLVRWLAGIEVNFMRRRWAERSPGEMVAFDEREDAAASMWRLEELNFAEARRLSPEEAKQRARLWAETLVNMTLAKNQKYMAAVRLRYFDRFEYSTIEDALGLGKNQAKVYVQRGLKVLKQMHEADVPEDSPRAQGPQRDE